MFETYMEDRQCNQGIKVIQEIDWKIPFMWQEWVITVTSTLILEKEKKDILIESPPGSGKSVIAAGVIGELIVNDWGK